MGVVDLPTTLWDGLRVFPDPLSVHTCWWYSQTWGPAATSYSAHPETRDIRPGSV